MEQGLTFGAGYPSEEPQAGLTMVEATQGGLGQYRQLRASGVDHQDAMLAAYGAEPTGQTMEDLGGENDGGDPGGIGRFGLVTAGGRQMAADIVQGGARMLGYGDEPFIENISEVIAPSAETQADIAERFAERAARVREDEQGYWSGLAGDVIDTALLSSPQLAAGIAGAGAGRLLSNPVTRRLPGAVAAPVTRVAEAVGAAAPTAPQLYESGYDTAVANGLDPNDPAVQNRIAMRALVGTALETITPMSILNRWTGGRAGGAFNRNVALATAKGVGREAFNEGFTEAADIVTEAVLLDPTLREKMANDELSEIMAYAQERYGRDLLVGTLSGAAVGGGMSAPAVITQEKLQQARDRQSIRRLQETLSATELTPSDVEQWARTPGTGARVRAISDRLAKADMARFAGERAALQAPPEDLARPGAVERYRKAIRTQQMEAVKASLRYDQERDRAAVALGAKQRPSVAVARDRLRQIGIQVGDNMPGERARVMAAELDIGRRVVDTLKAAEAAATDPNTKAVIASEALNAERQYRATRVRAAAEAKGVPVGQIEQEMQAEEAAAAVAQRAAAEQGRVDAADQFAVQQQDDRLAANDAAVANVIADRIAQIPADTPPEAREVLEAAIEREVMEGVGRSPLADAEREAQGREAAVQRQAEIEFPPTMTMEQNLSRAKEIIAEYEADPDGDQKGLIEKIKRLTRQRRAATDQTVIDRMNSEIATLETRKGLPTPAVEAARRVLQAQAAVEDVPTSIKAPTAQEAPAETVAASVDTAPAGAPSSPVLADSDTGERANERQRRGMTSRSLMPEMPPVGMEAVESVLLDFTRSSGAEAAAFVRPDGTVISMTTDDLAGGVRLPIEGRDDPEAIFTHTHTIETPFSAADIVGMMGGVPKGLKRTFRAVLPSGATVEMKPLQHINEEQIGSIYSLLADTIERSIRLSPADGPLRGDALQVVRLRQESLLQALDGAGIISYSKRLEGLTEAEQEAINDAITRAGTLLAPFRARSDDGTGSGGTRRKRRQAGEDRTEAEGEASEIDARIQQRQRSTANPERVQQLADELIAHAGRKRGSGRKDKLAKLLESGELTPESMRAGVEMAVREQGNKISYAIFNTARAMFPDKLWSDMPREKILVGKEKGKYAPAEEYQDMLTSAFWLINDVGRMEHGSFYRLDNYVISKRGLPFKTQFHLWTPKLRDFMDMSAQQDARFFPALENPDDTSRIKRSGEVSIREVDIETSGDPDAEDFDEDVETFEITKSGDNRFSMSAIEPARRTARYLQANKYTIDEAYLAKVRPEQMLSKKSLGADGIDVEDVEAFLRMEDGQDLSEDEKERLLDTKGGPNRRAKRIAEKLKTADVELERLRTAAKAYRREHGRKPIGFVYRVDDKGRIYADGQFTPQSTEAVKAAFNVDGKSLADMSTVDASASGWQVAALMARDHVVADNVNLTPGRGKKKGEKKRDMYNDVIADVTEAIERDAADPTSNNHKAAKIFSELLVNAVDKKGNVRNRITRNMIKSSVIAVNYGAEKGKFTESFRKAFGDDIKRVHGKATPIDYMWSYIGGEAYGSLARRAPHTIAFQNWALRNLEVIIKAVEGRKEQRDPSMTFTVGVDGDFQRRRNRKEEIFAEVRPGNARKPKLDNRGRPIIENGDIVPLPITKPADKEDHATIRIDYQSLDVDEKKTARSIYSQKIQAFDAAILHRSIERYKQVTKGAFITTNHDAFTVPKEHEGAISAAVAESMAAVLGGVDVPRRLYDEIMDIARREYANGNLTDADMAMIEKKVQPFTDYGKYNVSEVATASPVFVDVDGTDVVPDWMDLPGEGSDLMKASDVNVARYMEQLPTTSRVLQAVQNVAADPLISTRKFAEYLADNVQNQLNPIQRLEKSINQARGKGRVLDTGMDSMFKLSEVAMNDSGRNEMLLYAGAADYGKYGEYTVANDTIGIYDIWRIAGGGGADRGQRLQDWGEWMLARRAQQLNAKGIKTPQTPADIAAALAKHRPEFDEAATAWRKHNNANLRFLEKSGRINAAQRAAMEADAFYIPFYRTEDRVDGTAPDLDLSPLRAMGMGKNTSLMARDPGIKKMIGGDKMQIQNVFETMMRNSQAMVAAGMRNRATNKVMDTMQVVGLADFMPISSAKPNPNAVRVWRNGTEMWAVPKGAEAYPLMVALMGLQPRQIGQIQAVLRQVASGFRQSITISAAFILKNLYRGFVSTGMLTSGANMTWKNNTATGLVDALYNGPMTQAFKRQSGMGDFRFGGSDIGLGKRDLFMDLGLMSKWRPAAFGYYFRKFVGGMEYLGTATELADRVAAYKTFIENGARPDEAAYQALSIINYNRKGAASIVQTLVPLVPFLNAMIQGYGRLADGALNRDASQNTRGKALLKLTLNGLILTGASVAVLQMLASDEEDWARYKNEPLHTRINNWVFYVNGIRYTLPKPFDLGHIFASIPELGVMHYATDGDMNAFGGMWQILKQNFGMKVIPHAFMPALEVMTGYDFFTGREIEPGREKRLEDADRQSNASPLSIALGQRTGLSNFTGLSPSEMEKMFQGYGGLPYAMLSMAVTSVASELRIIPKQPSPIFGYTPVASPVAERMFGWLARDADMTPVQSTDDVYRVASAIERSYQSFVTNAREHDTARVKQILRDNPDLARQHQIASQSLDALGELSAAERSVRNDRTTTPQRKEELLRDIYAARRRLTEGVMRLMREAGIE